MKPRKKITRAEMRAIVDDYHRLLPDWQHVSPETLARADGPILQGIGFQSLSWGDYRPMAYISILAKPAVNVRSGVDFFAQMPKGRPRTVPLRAHKALVEQMFETMKREFKPAITDRLDATRLLRACESDAVPTVPQAYALAALNAYFGRDDRALYWCSQYPKLFERLGLEWQEADFKRKEFLDSLERWLRTGEAKIRLNEVLFKERAKWGIV